MKNFIVSLIIIVILVAAIGAGIMYSGAFNVAATSKDPAIMAWIIKTTREHSIEHRSQNIIAPPDNVLNSPDTLREGFEHYNEMCVMCHGAPGIEPGEAREGLNPKPPILAKLKDLKTDPIGEIFWVIKNGIKMTAMPAWGPTHSDNKIWAMVSFVRKLPSMSAEEYKKMQQELAASGHDHDHDEHGEAKPHDDDHEH